ncbi:MAG: hypothetical protein KDD65_14945 [Bacteroidetes bacterium]|nr:hypothetical protein [Bacteroidota bacterium]
MVPRKQIDDGGRNRLTINGEVRDALMYGLVPEDLLVVSGGPSAGYKSVEKRTLC